MELATEPLTRRAPLAMSAEHRADPWGEFLHRTLVSIVPAGAVQAATLAAGSALSQSASVCDAALAAEPYPLQAD